MSERYPREFDDRRVLPVVPGFLPDDVVRSDQIVPIGFDADHRLVVGVLESCEDETLEKVVFICNREVKVVIVSDEAMAYAIERYVLPG